MKVYVKGNISNFGYEQARKIIEAKAVFYNKIDSEIIQAEKNNPHLTLINFTDTTNWVEIFKNKISLTFVDNKDKILALTLDGARYEVSKSQQLELIEKLLNSKYYKTKVIDAPFELSIEDKDIIETYPKYLTDEIVFGTFAIRKEQGFITSTRGKQKGVKEVSYVKEVDHCSLEVLANCKATLNAPLLDKIFQLNPHIKYLLHGHELIGRQFHPEYEFAGTIGDLKFATTIKSGEEILLPFHGYYVGFKTYQEIKDYISQKIWNNYKEQFPERYFQAGLFEEELEKFLKHKTHLKVLDIGGGQEGTKILNRLDLEVYYLDPFIVNPPNWIKQRVNWDTPGRFDLIVARGCINYLSKDQLEKIPLMLNKGGTFMANSFLNPPVSGSIKKVKNLSGEEGSETVLVENGTIKHQIKFKNYQVDHTFFYYSLEDYFKAFKVLGYVLYGKNSVLLKIMN